MAPGNAILDEGHPADASAASVSEIDPRAAAYLVDAGDAVLIDVREPDERLVSAVPGSMPMPLSAFEPDAVMAAVDARRPIFHCRSGRRSVEAAALFTTSTGLSATSLAGGIQAWRAAGLPTRSAARSPIPIMRQVQIVIGVVAVVFTLLGALVNPWFLAVPGFLGGGLVYAGVSGNCGMATALALMPWNRVRPASGDCCDTGSGAHSGVRSGVGDDG